MTKTEPRSAGSGGGRDKTHPTPTELLALADKIENWDFIRGQDLDGWAQELRTIATTLSAREDGWQPIETCPNELVLLYWPPKPGAYRMLAETIRIDFKDRSPHRPPTHWQPLPKAPTAGEGKT